MHGALHEVGSNGSWIIIVIKGLNIYKGQVKKMSNHYHEQQNENQNPNSLEALLSILKSNKDYLYRVFSVKNIGVYGSFTQGTFNSESDVDLVIEFEKPIGLDFIRLSDFLEELLGRKVDLLTPEGIKSIRIDKVRMRITEGLIYV